jgi:hypothetical protein
MVAARVRHHLLDEVGADHQHDPEPTVVSR